MSCLWQEDRGSSAVAASAARLGTTGAAIHAEPWGRGRRGKRRRDSAAVAPYGERGPGPKSRRAEEPKRASASFSAVARFPRGFLPGGASAEEAVAVGLRPRQTRQTRQTKAPLGPLCWRGQLAGLARPVFCCLCFYPSLSLAFFASLSLTRLLIPKDGSAGEAVGIGYFP